MTGTTSGGLTNSNKQRTDAVIDLTDPVFDQMPTMPHLRSLRAPKPNGEGFDTFDVAARIGSLYRMIGTILLNDHNGNEVENIWNDNVQKVVETNANILMKWLEGGGKQPVTWRTLIQVLEDNGKKTLAQDIKVGLRYVHNR